MFLLDLPFIFIWWSIFLYISIAFLPLTTLIFSNFFDKGYIFAKILGILFLSYSIWLLASLKIVPFTTPSLFILLALFLLLNIKLAYQKQLYNKLRPFWKIFLFEEILFTAGLIFWSYIKAHQPSIQGLEKFMDFGIINSILRSDSFPPKDIWMSPLSINYYYFGHLTVAVLTKLSNLNPAVTYNLFLATLFGLTLSASFSIAANLYYFFGGEVSKKKVFFAGILGAFLVTMTGNLQTIYAFFQNYSSPENPVPFWQLKPMFNFLDYWYPNATRFIPNTIHEFPLYSFVVSDLHGHVLNIPFVLLLIALLIKLYHQSRIHLWEYAMLGFLIAIFLMTNILDGPIYLLLISLIFFFKKIHRPPLYILLVALLGIIFSLPFWLSFKPFSSGIGVLCAPQFLIDLGRLGPVLFEANHCQRSPIWMLFIVYGFFYIVAGGFLILVVKPAFKKLVLPSSYSMILIFILFSTLAILIPEFIYVKDIYPGHYRANTVFKFGYQAFIILSIASSFMILRIVTQRKFSFPKIIYYVFLSVAFFLITIFPYFAIRSYYNSLKNYHGLNGLTYLQTLYPSDYQAILWLKNNIKGQPVILEAVGESYTDFARVSANTGLPTVIGWPVHEWLWRGSPDEGTKRSAEVALLYEDPDKTLELIKKYNISLVFIGQLEKQKYKKLNENKFYNLGNVIYKKDQTTIYQLR